MGLSQVHALGRNTRMFARRETALASSSTSANVVHPRAADAFKVLKASIKGTQARKDRMDARQTRSTIERILGMKTVEWSIEKYAMGSGTAGTPPNDHPLWQGAFGTYANTPSTSDVYTPADTQAALGSTMLAMEHNQASLIKAVGSWVESWKFTAKGGDEPRVVFAGGACDWIFTGPSTTSGSLSGGESSVTVQTNDADNFEVGSMIQVGTSNNSGGNPPGHLVTAKAGAVLTITPIIVGAQSSGVDVLPYVPVDTGTTGSPIAGILGSVTLTGTAASAGDNIIPITECEVELVNNIKPFTDQAFTATVPDYIPGFRTVKGSITLRARKDQMIRLGHYRNDSFTQRVLTITCGSTAGQRIIIAMNNVEIEVPDFDVPESEEALIKLSFVALGTGAGANEITVTFN
jgi:hypothetical protein